MLRCHVPADAFSTRATHWRPWRCLPAAREFLFLATSRAVTPSRLGSRIRSSALEPATSDRHQRLVAFAIAPRSCELAIPFAKSTCPVAASVTAAARRSRQCRQVCWTSIPSKPDHVLRRHGRYCGRSPATSITGLSLGQRERSAHRCRHTRCPNSSEASTSRRATALSECLAEQQCRHRWRAQCFLCSEAAVSSWLLLGTSTGSLVDGRHCSSSARSRREPGLTALCGSSLLRERALRGTLAAQRVFGSFGDSAVHRRAVLGVA